MVSFGTDETIDRIVETYSAMLLKLVYTRLNSMSDAEDAVQDTFLRLLRYRPSFKSLEHEKAWLIRTALSCASDIHRSAAREDMPLEGDAYPAQEGQDSQGLVEAVRALPEKYSSVIHLYYYEGYSIKEIAKILGVPSPTVGTRLARGRKQLEKILKGEI